MKMNKSELRDRLALAEKERSELQDALSDRIIADTKLIEELEEKSFELFGAKDEIRNEKRKKRHIKKENIELERRLAIAEELFRMASDAWRFREMGGEVRHEKIIAKQAEFDSRKCG